MCLFLRSTFILSMRRCSRAYFARPWTRRSFWYHCSDRRMCILHRRHHVSTERRTCQGLATVAKLQPVGWHCKLHSSESEGSHFGSTARQGTAGGFCKRWYIAYDGTPSHAKGYAQVIRI